MDDAQLYFFANIDLKQRLFQGLNGTGGVTLKDEVKGIDLTFLKHIGEVFQRYTLAALSQQSVTGSSCTLVSDLTGSAVLRGHQEGVTSARNAGQTQYLSRASRAGLFQRLTVFVKHGTHATVGRTSHDGVTHAQGSTLNQYSCHRTATAFKLGFNSHTASISLGVGA